MTAVDLAKIIMMPKYDFQGHLLIRMYNKLLYEYRVMYGILAEIKTVKCNGK